MFGVEGLGEVVPDYLSVAPGADCNGSDGAVWELWGFRGDDLPLAYGVPPTGAHVGSDAADLVDGETYAVSFGKRDGSGWAANNRWTGFLVWGAEPTFSVGPDVCP